MVWSEAIESLRKVATSWGQEVHPWPLSLYLFHHPLLNISSSFLEIAGVKANTEAQGIGKGSQGLISNRRLRLPPVLTVGDFIL